MLGLIVLVSLYMKTDHPLSTVQCIKLKGIFPNLLPLVALAFFKDSVITTKNLVMHFIWLLVYIYIYIYHILPQTDKHHHLFTIEAAENWISSFWKRLRSNQRSGRITWNADFVSWKPCPTWQETKQFALIKLYGKPVARQLSW